MADIPLDNIGGEACEPIAGIAGELYYAEHSDFETLNDPKDLCGDSPEAAATLAELVEIETSHTFKTGKKWAKIPAVLETGTVTTTQIGEKKRRLMQNQVVFQVAGSESSVLGFMRYVKNKDLIMLFKEAGSGNARQIGSSLLPGWVESQEHLIEAVLEGNNSLTFTAMDKQKWPAPIYKGDIVTEIE